MNEKRDTVARIVRAIYGYGEPDSARVVAALSDAAVDDVLALEDAGNRKAIRGYLSAAVVAPPIENPESDTPESLE